jgi:(R)-2-hydroxyacyl-CoA dehydratese activating ATPase
MRQPESGTPIDRIAPMIVVGIDAGLQTTKVVIINQGTIASRVIVAAGRESTAAIAERALGQALGIAGVIWGDVCYVVATGVERRHVPYAQAILPESLCLAKGMHRLAAFAGTVLDIGAHKALAVQCDSGIPLRTAHNDRCASGTGTYLEMVAELLGISIAETGILSLRSQEPVEVQSTCAVFAESEIISLLHQRKKPEDILRGVFRSLAARVYPLLLSAGWADNAIAMVGGVARNIGVVKALEEQARRNILVPENPEMVGALGAALIAMNQAGDSA